MAIGDLITRDAQIEWNGALLLGSGTPYGWGKLSGWGDRPGVDLGNQARAADHGSHPGQPWAQERVITWEFQMYPDAADFAAACDALEMATPVEPGTTERPLVIRTRGRTRVAYAKVANRGLPEDKLYFAGRPKGILVWTAADPRLYSLEQYTIHVSSPSLPPGLQYPLTYPLDYGGAIIPSSGSAVNAGNTATRPLVTFVGPSTNPSLINTTTNRLLAFDIVLASGEELVVDTLAGSVLLGAADRSNTLADLSVAPSDFELVPGTNGLTFSSAFSGAGTGVDVTWRSAWM